MFERNKNISWPGWETVRIIGRGSFGAVYEIQREVFGEIEKAALKHITIPQNDSDIEELYSDGYDDESITSTFQSYLKSIVAEYTLMRKMNGSPNIVNCEDIRYVQHDNGIGWDIFIKMELLTPLVKTLSADISDDTVIKLGMDICAALELCAMHNIIHRDIKPQNIFLSPYGDYKLGDFGIAKTVEKTMGGTKIGTYKYMAPEVYNNQPYGSSADIYSLGLVLYWMLNERRMPFMPLPPEKPSAGMEEDCRARRLTGEALPPPVHGSEELKRIVLKACACEPSERYHSATEMLLVLKSLTVGYVPQPEAFPAKGDKTIAISEVASVASESESRTCFEVPPDSYSVQTSTHLSRYKSEQIRKRKKWPTFVAACVVLMTIGFLLLTGKVSNYPNLFPNEDLGDASLQDGNNIGSMSVIGPADQPAVDEEAYENDDSHDDFPNENSENGASEQKDTWNVIGSICGTNWDVDFAMTEGPSGIFTSDVFELKAGDEFKVRFGSSWDQNFGMEYNGANCVVGADGKYKVQFTWSGADNGTVLLINVATDPDEIADVMISQNGNYEVAFITDVGRLKDKGFNEDTYDGVKLFAAGNGFSYKYYQPANGAEATNDDRYNAMKAAVENGAKVVVAAGFMQAAALQRAAEEFPDVKFIFIDGWDIGLPNVAGVYFKEEQAGFLAGYAVVMDGYRNLGFSGGGGGTNPACCRYAYGYAQGANAAAAEFGVQVNLLYSWKYGEAFSQSHDLQSMLSRWYGNGTEVIFVCGGSMFYSAISAADASGGAVIGVDVDQSIESHVVVTSAMKNLAVAAQWAIANAYSVTWPEIAGNGVGTSLGMAEYAVCLPETTWSFKNFSLEEYWELCSKMHTGEITVPSHYPNMNQLNMEQLNMEQPYSNLTLTIEE